MTYNVFKPSTSPKISESNSRLFESR